MSAPDLYARALDALARAGLQPSSRGFATCPVCLGNNKLHLTQPKGKLKAKCSAGCDEAAILATDALVSVVHPEPQRANHGERPVAALTNGAGREKGENPAAIQLIEIGSESPLFADSAGRAYCLRTLPSGGTRAVALGSGSYKSWLAGEYHRRTGGMKAATADSLQTALGVLTARAHEGQRAEVATRVAERGGAIYLDLADEAGRAVRMTSEGWSIIDRPPLPFRVAPGMLPLPSPERGGSLDELRSLLNAPGDNEWRLIVGWLIAAMRPDKPFPILVLQGEQGSAKSTTARMLRGLLDPATPAHRGKPRDERTLAIAARNGWVLAYDNLSGLPEWLSDALSRIATGGGLAERQLHTDCDEVLFEAMRPIMANGIDEVATRPDLADRALRVTLPVISDDSRRELAEVEAKYEEIRPRALGALCDAVCGALRELPQTRVEKKPRMADFARWVTAAEPALGWTRGAFLASYSGNRADLVEQSLEADPVASTVRRLLDRDGGSWSGTAGELLDALGGLLGDPKPRDWPENPRTLSNRLRRMAPHLRAVGVGVDGPTPTGHSRRRLYTLQWTVRTVRTVRGHRVNAAGVADEADEARTKLNPVQEAHPPPPADDADGADARVHTSHSPGCLCAGDDCAAGVETGAQR